MKRYRKQILLLALIVLVAVLIPWHSPRMNEEPKQEEEQKVLRLVAPFTNRHHRQMLLDLAEDYGQAQDKVRLDVEFIPHEDQMKRLLLRYLQDAIPPDLIVLGNNNVRYLAQEGFLCEVTGLMEALEAAGGPENGFHPALLSSNVLQSRRYEHYAVPFTASGYALFINESILNTHGIPIPQDWLDIEIAARRVMVYGPEGLGIAARHEDELANQFLNLYFTAGGNLNQIDGDSGREAFAMIERLGRNGTLSLNSVNYDQRDLTKCFLNQEVIMMLGTSDQIPAIREGNSGEDAFRWSAVPIPEFDGAEYRGYGTVSAQSIAAANPETLRLAEEFIYYISQPERQVRTALEFGGIPVRTGLDRACTEDERNVGGFIYRQIETAEVIGPYRLWPNIAQSFQSGLFDIMTQTTSAQEAAAQIQAEVRGYRFSS